ncbi:hypothetical protein [Erythrobacter litoralis]|uniref:hypothetical protein n=1 Tax=Erythrobacter litoralis TaxID=39960 RepID=UPI00243544ED|nr:hypothetical protein [Erythrobacter litoralis]
MPIYFGVVVLALLTFLAVLLSRRRPEPGATRWRRTSMLLAALTVGLGVYDLIVA